MRDTAYLRGHRSFCSLKPRELEELALGFSRLFCPAGKTLILKDSPLEGLYLLQSGLCRICHDESPLTLAGGDLFFENSLIAPSVASDRVEALEDSLILYLDRSYFLRWSARYPKALNRLAMEPFQKQKKGFSPPLKVLKETRLLWLLKSLPWILFPPALLVRIFFRHRNGTFIENSNLVCRYFRPGSLKNTNLTIPLEQIQSVEVVQRGIMSRLLRIGDLLVRVNGPQGSMLIRNIPRPGEEQERILSLKRKGEELVKARKHELIRRDIAGWVRLEEGVKVLEEGLSGRSAHPVLAVEFGKSFFVLLGRGWWQIFLCLGFMILLFRAMSQDSDWLIFPVLALGGSLFLFLYTLIDWLNDKYKVEEGYLLDLNREPFGKKMTRKQADLDSIQNVIAEQKGFWANIFDFGDVRVIIPGSGEEICLSGVKKPRQVQERLLYERKRWKEIRLEKESLAGQEDLKLYLSYASQELLKKNRS